jgi:hypothetical protein
MKKLAILFFGAGLFLTSCTGDYACVCTEKGVKEQDGPIYKGVTKAWMKDQGCVSRDYVNGTTITSTECEIEKK